MISFAFGTILDNFFKKIHVPHQVLVRFCSFSQYSEKNAAAVGHFKEFLIESCVRFIRNVKMFEHPNH